MTFRKLIGSNVYVGQNVKFYPGVFVSENTFVDDNVVLGYPNDDELGEFVKNQHAGRTTRLDDYVKKPTEIGSNGLIRSGTKICSGTKIGANFRADHDVFIGGNNTIGTGVSAQYGAMIYSNNIIGDSTVIAGFVCNGCIIGKTVAMLGYLVHKYDRPVEVLPELSPIVEDGATIGMHATIVGNVTIGRNAYVAAGSVVTKDVKPQMLVAGVPAREKKVWPKRVV